MSLFWIFLLTFLSYVIGSIPTGYWLTKALKGIDIRNYGSGSTGATNVWRCVGRGPGVAVFVIDLLKGIIPVGIAIAMCAGPDGALTDPYQLTPVMFAAAALIGHSKSIFLNFQGGKSAATGLGTLLALKPVVGAATFGTWLVVLILFRIVSLASIVATGFCGMYMWALKAPITYIAYCILGFAYVTYRHKANISRMLAGTEPRLGEKPPNVASSAAQANNDLVR